MGALETVAAGGFQINGNVTELKLPKLESVGEEFSVSRSDFNCSAFEVALGGSDCAFEESLYCNKVFTGLKGVSVASTASTTSTIASKTSLTSTNPMTPHDGSSSLSTGAAAGIGVGVGFICAAVLVFMLIKRRRRT